MNSRLIDTLRTSNFVALILCSLLLLYMVFAIPSFATLWADKQWAAEQVARAETPEQLRQTLRFAVTRTSDSLHAQGIFLYTLMFATCGMIGVLGWNLLLIRRLKRENSNGQGT
jgi:hypothetical protein